MVYFLITPGLSLAVRVHPKDGAEGRPQLVNGVYRRVGRKHPGPHQCYDLGRCVHLLP